MNADALSGALDNAANGERLVTSDGGGSFRVHYGAGSLFDPTNLVLSDFQLGGASLQGVHMFYNNSTFDANGPAVTSADFAAIATDKSPLAPGDTASFVNISGYSRGINGIFIDAAGLPNDGAGIDANDFSFRIGNTNDPDTWAGGPVPTAVDVLPGAGQGGADRILVTFADESVKDTWLRMTVKATPDTGLAADAHYFFGNAAGETGAGFVPGVVGVDAADLQFITQQLTPLAQSGTELITQAADVNRDRTVNAFDFQVVTTNLDSNVINLITPQLGSAVSLGNVPEPSTLFVAVTMLAAGIASRCSRLRFRRLKTDGKGHSQRCRGLVERDGAQTIRKAR
jgi:hypothetical protein